MKVATGEIRKVSAMGAVTLPKSILIKKKINPYDEIIFSIEGENVILQKYKNKCKICRSSDELIKFKNIFICNKCKNALKEINKSVNILKY